MDDGTTTGGIQILNELGTEVETLRTSFDEDFGGPARYEPGPTNAALEQLHEAARRSALDIDGILEDLFKQLK